MSLSEQPLVKVRNFFMWMLGIIALFYTFVSGFLELKVEKTKEGKWRFIWDGNLNREILELVLYGAIVVAIVFVLLEILSRSSSPSFQEDLKERQLFYFLAWFGVIKLTLPVILPFADKFVEVDLTIAGMVMLIQNIIVTLFIFILFRKNLSLIGINRPNSYRRLILGIPVGYIMLVIFVNGLVGDIIQSLLPVEFFSYREELIREDAESYWLLSLISVTIMAPIAEELIYRGVFQTYLIKRLGVFFGVLLSSLAFAVMHFDPAVLLIHTSMGIVFGVSRLYTNSIWLPIILHMINNCVVFLFGGGA